jgi:hypothetical protein
MRFLISLLPLMLSACVGSSTPPEPQPTTRPVVQPAPVPPPPVTMTQPKGHWTDWPITPGDWVYRADERGSIGYFGETGKNAIVTLRCDKARGRMYLSRAGALIEPQITVRTSSASKTLPAASAGGNPPFVAAELMPLDPILDAITYSRGRISIEAGGHMNIAIPVWAEIGRIIEDCRA